VPLEHVRLKALLFAALIYIALPFDLIPDFLPIVGHLDDLIIVLELIALAIWLIPTEVLVGCRE
jgi:carbonic anhydrase